MTSLITATYSLYSSQEATSQAVLYSTRSQNINASDNSMTWVYLTIALIGLVSNSFVIVVVLSSDKLKKQPRNWFIFYKSVSDFASAIFILTVIFKNAKITLQAS